MSPQTQTYANHVRWFPLVHFVILPIVILNFIYQTVRFFQEPGLDRGVWVVLCLAIVLMVFASRLQALRAQDRVIRLEERLRYMDLLPVDAAARAANFRTNQIVALRFASDGELPDLVAAVTDGKLTTSKEIKMAIKHWRGDYLRV